MFRVCMGHKSSTSFSTWGFKRGEGGEAGEEIHQFGEGIDSKFISLGEGIAIISMGLTSLAQ